MKIKSAEFSISNSRADRCPDGNMPEFAFIGRSNVGKSSLINMLTGRKGLAMTSSTPGKTMLINHFIINGEWYLVDLPGYGYAKVAKGEKRRWAEMMEGYFQSPRNIKLVVQLVDMRHKPSEDDYIMMRYLQDAGLPFIVAATKCDKLNKSEFAARLSAVKEEMGDLGDGVTVIPFSALKGTGADEIRNTIEKSLLG